MKLHPNFIKLISSDRKSHGSQIILTFAVLAFLMMHPSTPLSEFCTSFNSVQLFETKHTSHSFTNQGHEFKFYFSRWRTKLKPTFFNVRKERQWKIPPSKNVSVDTFENLKKRFGFSHEGFLAPWLWPTRVSR